jgi:hypothetical protein
MNPNYIIFFCVLAFLVTIGLAINKYVINKPSSTPQVSPISTSLAQIIAGSLNNNIEYFTAFPINIQKQIAEMLEKGDIVGIEKLVQSQGLSLSELLKELIKTSEVNNIDMITDPLIKQISLIMKAQNEISGIQIEINFLQNIAISLYPGRTPDPSITSLIAKLNEDLLYYQNIINSSPSLQSLLDKITEPGTLSHVLEIQTRLQNLHKKRFIRLLKEMKIKYIGRVTLPPYVTNSPNNLLNLLARYIKNYNDDDNKNIRDNLDTMEKRPERIKIKEDRVFGSKSRYM